MTLTSHTHTTKVVPVAVTPPAHPFFVGKKDSSTGLMALEYVEKLGQMIARSHFFPAYTDKAEDAAMAILYGQSLGMSWGHSLLNIAVIKGRPTVWGDAMLSLCKVAPDYEYCHEKFDPDTMTATCEAKRKNEDPSHKTFSKEDAIRAALWDRTPSWVSYPQRMLQMRARSWALRDTFPHILHGVYCTEEMMNTEDLDFRQTAQQSIRHKEPSAPQPPSLPVRTQEAMTSLTFAKLLQATTRCAVKPETIRKWTDKAGVQKLAELTEAQATAVLDMLEKQAVPAS